MRWVSRYMISVPIPSNEHCLLVHGYTGALDMVDAQLAEQLIAWSDSGSSITSAALDTDTLQYLEERGYITDMSIEEETAFVGDLARELHQKSEKLPPHFYIMPTYNCQLRCTYCFESYVQARARREGWLSEIMAPEIVDAAFRSIDRLNAGKSKKSIELYGGEPLMRRNRACVERIVEREQERGYIFLAATNGTDLDAYLDLLGPDRIASVQVPVDGVQESHDKLRRQSDGSPTFERIMRNVQLALERDVQVKLRVNVTRDVLEHLDEFIALLTQRGFAQSPHFSCYFKAVFPSTPLTSTERRSRGYVTEAEVVQQISRYPELAEVMTGYPITDSRVRALFESRIWSALNPSHCGATSSIYVLDPFGRIYPCNNVVGNPQHCIGSFSPYLEWNEQLLHRWHQRSVENMPECLQCKYALLCGGGCPYRALVDHGDLYAPHCDGFAHSFEAFILWYHNQYCSELPA